MIPFVVLFRDLDTFRTATATVPVMPRSFSSQDSHLSGSDQLSTRSTTASTSVYSFCSTSTSPSTSQWTLEDTASSARMPSGSRPDKDVDIQRTSATERDLVRPEPLRAFATGLSDQPRSAIPSKPAEPARYNMAVVGRSGAHLPEQTPHRLQHSQHQQHPRRPEQRGEMEGHQQAANYASLAALGQRTGSDWTARRPSAAEEIAGSWASSLNDPAYAGAVRLLTENLLAAESAPRLSTSSVESTSTSELHTPENCHQPWPLTSQDLKAASPFPTTMSSHPESRLADPSTTGLHAGGVAALPLRSEREEIGSRDAGDGALVPADIERSTTVKRPSHLSRLSSNATNVTARPSPPDSSSASPVTAGGPGGSSDVLPLPDIASLRLRSNRDAPEQGSLAQSVPLSRMSLSHDAVYSCATASSDVSDNEARVLAGTSGRKILASPDSWRSLLPEHDPFFVPDSSFSLHSEPNSDQPCKQGLLSQSPAEGANGLGALGNSLHSLTNDRSSHGSFDMSRASFSSTRSQLSSMSGGGHAANTSASQSRSHVDNDSWRCFLPDSDRFSLRNAPSPSLDSAADLQKSSNADAKANSTERVDIPVNLDALGHRAAFMPLRGVSDREASQQAKEASGKRHASFSSYGTSGLASGLSSPRAMLASTRRPTVIEAFNRRPELQPTPTQRQWASTKAIVPPVSSIQHGALELGRMHSSSSSMDFDDLEDRESWPTSKGRSRYLSDTGSEGDGSTRSTAAYHLVEASGTAQDHRQNVDGVSSDAEIGPGKIDEESSSVFHTTPKGIMATTTTKTTRTTTTSTLIAPNNGEGSARTQTEQSTKRSDDGLRTIRRSARCSVTAPLSPPSLPFLDRRPAPPETELFVETETKQYTLVTRLPGFSIDCITLATKQHQKHRTLHLVADKFDADSGGHFERRITFPEGECDLIGVKAEFDGTTLRIIVPRIAPLTDVAFSSASSATF